MVSRRRIHCPGPVLAMLLVLVAAPAEAHDFWLAPGEFRPAVGAAVPIEIHIGTHYTVETRYPRSRRHALRFEAIGPGEGREGVPGREGAVPAGRFTPGAAGPWIVVYMSAPSEITLGAAEFERYLVEEGLAHVAAARKASGATAKPGRERFSRFAKALLAAGGRSGPALTRPVGLPFEIVPEADPYTLRPGGTLPVRLLFRGKPLAGARVVAYVEPGKPAVQVRTDAAGRAALVLHRPGRWMVKAVHMIPVRGRVDWASVWASLTFELP